MWYGEVLHYMHIVYTHVHSPAHVMSRAKNSYTYKYVCDIRGVENSHLQLQMVSSLFQSASKKEDVTTESCNHPVLLLQVRLSVVIYNVAHLPLT